MNRRLRRGALLLVAVALASGGALAGAAPRAARPRLSAERAHIRAGATVTLHGSGFPRRAAIVLLAAAPHRVATRIGSARTGIHGGFVAPIRIDPHATPGLYVATACRDDCRLKASVHFRVLSR